MIDTATAKQLLQSNDVAEIQAVVTEYKDFQAPDVSVQFQVCKLLLLLQNRILQLQTTSAAPAAEQSTTYVGMAECWLSMGDLEKCQGQVGRALALDAENADAMLLLGEVQSAQAKYEAAIEHTERAVAVLSQKQKLPELGAAYSKLAAIYEMMGEFDQAVTVLQKAVGECCNNNSSDNNNNDNDGDATAAAATLTSALLHGYLGTIQEKLGLYQEAVTSLTVAAAKYRESHGADHPKTQEVEFLLEMASTVH